MSYPNPGTPPTSFVPVYPVTEHLLVHHTVTTLAFTGADIVQLAVIGLLCVFAGLAFVSLRRGRL